MKMKYFSNFKIKFPFQKQENECEAKVLTLESVYLGE